jgi:uracil-DNA glycosylase
MTRCDLLTAISACRVCEAQLPLGPRPVVRAADPGARILIIGQAPGTRVHASGVPWDDASGKRLRGWLCVGSDDFYDQSKFAIVPMGFCYPGRGKGGDNPPRPECAPLWHARVLKNLPNIQLTLLIGSYAQGYYLRNSLKASLGETVRAWQDYIDDGFLPLVHPSPRNEMWLRRNPWFEAEIVPALRERVRRCLFSERDSA